jgi:lysophospholipase L1-like esterase
VSDPQRILLAGDSTVAACPAHETPMSGWGPHLGASLNFMLAACESTVRPTGPIQVLNVARGGATTESHRVDGLWAALLYELHARDIVLLQFGHNDRKWPHLAPDAGYKANLNKACDEVLARGGIPVLCTPVERRTFTDGQFVPAHGRYPEAVRELAQFRGLPCIDLTSMTARFLADLGPDDSLPLFTHFQAGEHPLYSDGIADDTHFSFIGAVQIADFVAQELVRLWPELTTTERQHSR